MHRYLSPLRYPGGKAKLAPFVAALMSFQGRRATTYVEPFAGGAGVGLKLLYDERVDEIVLNDLDPGIAAFWRAVFERTEDFATLVGSTRVTIAEWHRQREIHDAKPADDIAFGFATFFLNRTNRSGIIDARPIGGLEQTGAWAIDARFDSVRLEERIRLLGRYGARVTIMEADGIEVVRSHLLDPNAFMYVDPPYLSKAADLYFRAFDWEDHRRLASVLRPHGNWMLTYDADNRIPTELYPGLRCASFDIAHTAGVQHVGSEFVVFATGLDVPPDDVLGRTLRYVA